MMRASGIITDVGSATGHLATIAREFRVPCILNTGNATQLLTPGQEITIDAEENVIYEGLDLFSFMIDKAEVNEQAETDISGLLTKIDRIRSNQDPEDECDCAEFLDDASQEQEELLTIYRDGYNQLGALKHLIYESVHLSDPESLAVLLSNQIHERMAPEQNGFWLVEGPNTLVEIARNGKLVGLDQRRKLEINSLQETIVTLPVSKHLGGPVQPFRVDLLGSGDAEK